MNHIYRNLYGAALAMFLGMSAGEAQELSGREHVLDNAPSVEDLNRLFGTSAGGKGVGAGHRLGTRSIVLTPTSNTNSSDSGFERSTTQVANLGDETRSGAKTVSIRLEFDLNSAEIRPEFEDSLAGFAKYMAENPDIMFMIGGHADASGDESYNIELSQRRAQRVKQFLSVVHGVDDQRFSVVGFGSGQPVTGLSPTDSRNRRVSFTIQ